MACTLAVEFEEEAVVHTTVSPDGQLISAGLLLLDAHTGDLRKRLSEYTLGITHHTALSPTNTLLVDISCGYVWDYSSGACVAQCHMGGCVAFSLDGSLMALGSNDGTVRLWRTDNWAAPLAVLKGHLYPVRGVSFSCDNRLLASCSVDRTVRLWHVLDTAAPATAAGPVLKTKYHMHCVAFSPVDTRLLACGGDDDRYSRYKGFLAFTSVSADSITVMRELQGHTDQVHGLAFSPCGKKLASASDDRSVRLWSVASGMCLRVLQGHTNKVRGVAFFPNGKQLVSCSGDRTVRVWTVCPWSDHNHHLFGTQLKSAVFTLMCVRAHMMMTTNEFFLPMELWLMVFEWLAIISPDFCKHLNLAD